MGAPFSGPHLRLNHSSKTQTRHSGEVRFQAMKFVERDANMQSKPTRQQVRNSSSEDTHPGRSSGLTTGSDCDRASLQATLYPNPGSRHMLQNLVAQKHGHSEGRLEDQLRGASSRIRLRDLQTAKQREQMHPRGTA